MIRKISTWVAAFALVLAGVFVSPGSALADDASEIPNCLQGHGGIGPTYGGGHYTGSGDWYAYSVLLVTPTSSACEDIQIKFYYSHNPNVKYRLRFYPSSGGSYTNAWRYAPGCYPTGGCTIFLLGTDILNNTYYRVEGVEQAPGSSLQTVVDRPFLLVW